MAIEKEIEFKQLLNLQSYESIKSTYFNGATPFKQTNHYIDTPDFQIQSQKMALRIREKADGALELTLKVPQAIGLDEYNFATDLKPIQGQVPKNALPKEIQSLLIEKHVNLEALQILGALTTLRLEKQLTDGLLVLDHSFYLGTEDYELEFEVKDFEKGQHAFNELLKSFHLKHQEPKNKVRRFFEYQSFHNQNNN